jgi:heme/copper-type cytochrome/quinol oxidase subunit 2
MATVFGILVFVAVGCGSSPSSSGGSSGSAASQQPSGQPLVIEITIKDGKVTPENAQMKVKVGQPIELRVTSDAEDQLHVHSTPDHTFKVEAKPNQSFQFNVSQPGQVEVELHELDRTVATIQAQ